MKGVVYSLHILMNVKMEYTVVEIILTVLILKGVNPVLVPLAISGLERHAKV